MAELFGVPVFQLLENIPSSELTEWAAYFRLVEQKRKDGGEG